MMTRKDFEAVATAISEEARLCPSPEAKFAVKMVASRLAAEFALINPRFDRERFMEASGVR